MVEVVTGSTPITPTGTLKVVGNAVVVVGRRIMNGGVTDEPNRKLFGTSGESKGVIG